MARAVDIDWSKIQCATSTENRPTPGYLFNEIVHNVSYAHPQEIPAVAAYLAACVEGDHAHVKLKALFVIKALAYRIPPFCNCFQEHIHCVEDAANFTGPPSALYGDEPYRLVREAAEGALTALTGGVHYHEQHRELSSRIVGFGNYLPGEDTVLPDGSVNVGRDITLTDVAVGTVGLVSCSVGAIWDGVKGLFTGGNVINQKPALESVGFGEEPEDEEQEDARSDAETPSHHAQCTDEDGAYQASAGSYVPPVLPAPAPPPVAAPAPAPVEADDANSSALWDLLNEPLADLNEPLADLSEPPADLSGRLADLSKPLANLDEPFADLDKVS